VVEAEADHPWVTADRAEVVQEQAAVRHRDGEQAAVVAHGRHSVQQAVEAERQGILPFIIEEKHYGDFRKEHRQLLQDRF
jgi:hypothetical protein